MSRAEKKLDLVLEWFEKNPGAYMEVKKKIKELNEAYQDASKFLINANTPMEKQAKLLNDLNAAHAEAATKIAKSDKGFALATATLEAQEKGAGRAGQGLYNFGKSMESAGRKVGFYGFIAAFSIQRLVRQVTSFLNVFKEAITVTAEWPAQLEKVVKATALLEMQGMLTADVESILAQTTDQLIEQGPAIEAAWGGLNAMWASIQTTLAVALLPTLTSLIAEVGKLLNTREMQSALLELAKAAGEMMFALLSAAPAVIQIATAVAWFAVALKPLYPIIVPLLAILFVLGTVCSVLGPIINILGATIRIVGVAHRWWAQQSIQNVATMKMIAISVVQVIAVLAVLAFSVWSLSNLMRVTTDSMTDNWSSMSNVSQLSMSKIVDENGNLIYSIDELTKTVYDSSGNIIGSYDSMTGQIIDSSGEMIGTIDQSTGKFIGLDGVMGTLQTSVSNLGDALKGLDTSEMTSGINNMTSATKDLTDQMQSLQYVMVAIAGINFANVIAQIAGIFGGAGGIAMAASGTAATATTAAAGVGITGATLVGALEAVAPPLVAVLVAKLVQGYIKSTESAEQLRREEQFEDIQKKSGMWRQNWWEFWKPAYPGGQFGIPKVPETGAYWLHAGEKVTSRGELAEESQQVVVYASILQGATISPGVDLESIKEYVMDGIAEGIRRKKR